MKTKCDHIVGEWDGCYEGGVVRVSGWNMHTNCERWNFCPLCGEDTSKLKKPRAYRSTPKHGEVTTALIKESERIGSDMLKTLLKKR